MIPIKRAELHTVLFLGGKNQGLKLENKSGLVMVYDRPEKELIVHFGGEKAILPSSNVASMVEVNPTAKIEVAQKAPQVHGKIKAQVSTPTDHVFSSGPGKTND